MNNAAMISTVPTASVAELPAMQETPKPAAAIVGFFTVGGRLIPMMADHTLDAVSLGVAALARQGLVDSGIVLE